MSTAFADSPGNRRIGRSIGALLAGQDGYSVARGRDFYTSRLADAPLDPPDKRIVEKIDNHVAALAIHMMHYDLHEFTTSPNKRLQRPLQSSHRSAL